MSKNIVYQVFFNANGVGKPNPHYPAEGIPDWVNYSHKYFEKYAEMHGADYRFFRDRFVKSSSNYFEKARTWIDPFFDQYDKVLYVDVDVMPKNMLANIFDIDVKDIAGWPEWRHPDLKVKINYSPGNPMLQRYKDFGAPMTPAKTNNSGVRMLNTGVLLWTREARLKARELFDDHEKWFHHKNPALTPGLRGVGHSSHCLDQVYLNAMCNKYNFDVLELGLEWNRLPTKDENRPCNFAHYVGDYRFDIPDMFEDISK
jgi:lipopolysaccharide biosynthesis glycosyltransferase